MLAWQPTSHITIAHALCSEQLNNSYLCLSYYIQKEIWSVYEMIFSKTNPYFSKYILVFDFSRKSLLESDMMWYFDNETSNIIKNVIYHNNYWFILSFNLPNLILKMWQMNFNFNYKNEVQAFFNQKDSYHNLSILSCCLR